MFQGVQIHTDKYIQTGMTLSLTTLRNRDRKISHEKMSSTEGKKKRKVEKKKKRRCTSIKPLYLKMDVFGWSIN